MNVLLKPTLAGLLLACCCAPSRGSVLVYEGFDLEPGTLQGNRRGASSFGWTASWNNSPFSLTQSTVEGGSLQASTAVQPFYSYQPVGNRGSSEDEDEMLAYRKINGAGFGNTVTGSFLVYSEATGGSTCLIGLELDAFALSGFNLMATASTWRLRGGRWENPQDYDTGIMASPGTHLVVFQLTLDASGTQDNFKLWLDREPTSTAPDFEVLAQFGQGAPSQFHFTANTGNSGYSFMEIDEIRLGTTLADVIPEPSSVLLIAGASVLITCCRRKR